MPSKKKKYNARFPAGRIKKIMQSDEEVGKVAQAVPIIISRTLELFVESLLTKSLEFTNARNAKTLSTSHMKQCIMSEPRFDFLRELVRNVPDISVAEETSSYNEEDNHSSPEEQYPDSDTPFDLSMPSTSARAARHQKQQPHITTNGLEEFQRTHLKRSYSSITGSVTKHSATTGLQKNSTDCPPTKLARSDSTPVPQHYMSSITATTQQQPQHPRLKHQSYSMPTSTIDTSCNKPNINCPPTQPLRLPTQTTAIPAPIVSFDYCNKPIVKIDYSNIPLTEISSTTPASAPANIASMSNNDSTFNFSTEPVINIDLSHMMNSVTGVTTASSISNMATISIGTPLTATNTTTSDVVEQQSRNSKVGAVAESFLSSLPSSSASQTANTNVATITPAKPYTSDSYLDMDEDYDNI